ncbi:DNA polymerase IV [Desulfuromonas carbonis]|uniref:DNA polymerase Y family protein n=1 Tax=Desulfuromonas sp. DDH964 TaxID=1823759 RepID=UPI00078B8174|nr:DNA polymerase IV [Desulfuromonas sp. DDH964]AMV73684.1 DNA polymerase IV [Desulfuromonas sp. DDH964]
MPRDILHLQIPAFAVAVARVVDSSLRGRPVAVAPGHSERALLQCVSAEAAADGVFAGMPLFQARRRCPALLLLPPDPELLGRAGRALLAVSAAYSPLIEPAAAGRLFLDLTGCGRLLGPGRDAAARLERELAARLHLAGSVGVAGNKLVSRIAAGYLERPGVCDVLRGAEEGFLGPLPVTVLPGIGAARQLALTQELNLRRVEELARLSIAQLRLPFGPLAPLLHQRARGIDPSPVLPPRQAPGVVEEAFLSREENDDELLLAELCRLAESCGRRLRRQGAGTAELALTLFYVDGVREECRQRLPAAQNHDLVLLAAAEELFRRACSRRLRVKGLRLACTRLGPVSPQVDLFTAAGPSPHQLALQQAIDALRDRYGMQVLRRGRALVT